MTSMSMKTMQSSINLNQVLQNISELSVEEQLYLSELLQKRLIEVRRTEIANRVKEAEENYRSGNVRSGSVSDLMVLSDDD
jgi:FKBP-type peptidyl-prolyl cis-trans isomerase (trigger factor)